MGTGVSDEERNTIVTRLKPYFRQEFRRCSLSWILFSVVPFVLALSKNAFLACCTLSSEKNYSVLLLVTVRVAEDTNFGKSAFVISGLLVGHRHYYPH